MKKLNTFLALALLVCCFCLAITGCKKEEPGTGGGSGDGGKTEVGIASLTATESSVDIKVGDELLLTSYYEIKGTSTLSAAQRACTYTSSNPEVVEISAKKAVAVSAGTATITITSNLDNTKSCSFEVVVGKIFFDRQFGFNLDDDFSNEWNDANDVAGSIQTTSAATNYYYAAGVCSTQWYFETDIVFNKVGLDITTEDIPDDTDRWPKIGIITKSVHADGTETMVAFYLNATIGLNDTKDEAGNIIKGEDNLVWNEFGVCEVNRDNWAWEENIADSQARHHDYAWNTGEATITYGTSFKLGVARDGANFHVYVNNNYVGSYQLDTSMGILFANGALLDSYVGVWEFASDATFSNYSVTTDAAAVAAKVPTTPVYVGGEDNPWNVDENEG